MSLSYCHFLYLTAALMPIVEFLAIFICIRAEPGRREVRTVVIESWSLVVLSLQPSVLWGGIGAIWGMASIWSVALAFAISGATYVGARIVARQFLKA